MEAPTMRLPKVKMLLCWPSRMQIYGFVENHTFLEQFVRMGVPAQFSNLGVPAQFSNIMEQFVSMGVPAQLSSLGVPAHFFSLGVPAQFSNLGYQHIFQILWSSLLAWGTSTIFSTLHGSLWLGKDKGSIMESAESCGTIHLEINFSSKVYSKSLLKGSPLSCTSLE